MCLCSLIYKIRQEAGLIQLLPWTNPDSSTQHSLATSLKSIELFPSNFTASQNKAPRYLKEKSQTSAPPQHRIAI